MGNKEFLYNSLYKKVLGEVSDIENISEKAINEYHKPFAKVIIDKSNPNKLGTVKKRFVRTKGSVLFDLFDEKRNNPNSNFVSCADPIIDDLSFSKEDFGNMYFSSIIKELRYGIHKFAVTDVIASKIANILGVKSAYNTLSPTGNYLISVDFLKDKEEIIDFGEFTRCPNFEASYPIEGLMAMLERGISIQLPKHQHVFERERKKILIDFIRMYIVRRLILQDDDLSKYNISFVHSKNRKNFSLAPVFDLEFCLGVSKGHIAFFAIPHEQSIDRSISYLLSKYPEETKIAMKDINVYHNKEKMQAIIDAISANTTSLDRNAKIEFVKDNLCNVCNSYERYVGLNMDNEELYDKQ